MGAEVKRFDRDYYDGFAARTFLRKTADKPHLYRYFRRYLKRLKKAGNLLDIGCGLGHFLRRLGDTYETYGIDISEYAVEKAKRTADRAKVVRGSATDLPFEEEYFDIVTAFDVVEHLGEPNLFFDEAHRILKREGILIFSTPNTSSLGARKKGSEWFGFRDSTHVSLLAMGEWREKVERRDFCIIRDGTDALWDSPYFKHIPHRLQWVLFTGLGWITTWAGGFYRWEFGENYICVAKKVK